MTPLRIAFDLDGVLADFDVAYRRVEQQIFGAADAENPVPGPELQAAAEEEEAPTESGNRRRDRVWREIEATPDFWMSLEPLDPEALPRLERLALQHRWEVFFVTHRPATAGDTVQRQSQRWLQRHGFELPSVLVLRGSRGALAASLHLDYLVDDTVQNCVDVVSDSRARVVLVLPRDRDGNKTRNARRLGMLVVPGISGALDILEDVQARRSNPSLLAKAARAIGWRNP
jgi:hypothetical protein